ncbi:MAG: DNA-binding response regulator [Spirochaetaceae bacterium]|nr:MAG: DNA-binding response regulator [Spirochaetaceae bacterium]
MNRRVLLVDDEPAIIKLLRFIFQDAGFDVESVGSGEEALAVTDRWHPDLVVLDIGLPGMSGLDVCRALHAARIPVLVLSSHDQDDDVVEGLEEGADDYVTKPFNHRELLLRAEKLIERGVRLSLDEETDLIQVGELEIDAAKALVRRAGTAIYLTPTEIQILKLLARTPGRPVDIDTILKQVWKHPDRLGGPEMVKVNIRRLRHKIETDPTEPRYILNRRGMGYYLEP